MESIYPVRSLIRFKAKRQLLAESLESDGITLAAWPVDELSADCEKGGCFLESPVNSRDLKAIAPFDDALFQVVVTTVLHPCRNPDVYLPYASEAESGAVEDRVAQDIVKTYHTLQQQPSAAVVAQLNRLL